MFQDTYKSETIAGDAYLLSVYRYILRNLQKAGICRTEEYSWSSYGDYGKTGVYTDTSLLQGLIGGRANLKTFLQQDDDSRHMEAEINKRDDTWEMETMKKTLGVTSGTQLAQLNRDERDKALVLLKEKGLSVRQIERLTGINRGLIQKAGKVVSKNRPRRHPKGKKIPYMTD